MPVLTCPSCQEDIQCLSNHSNYFIHVSKAQCTSDVQNLYLAQPLPRLSIAKCNICSKVMKNNKSSCLQHLRACLKKNPESNFRTEHLEEAYQYSRIELEPQNVAGVANDGENHLNVGCGPNHENVFNNANNGLVDQIDIIEQNRARQLPNIEPQNDFGGIFIGNDVHGHGLNDDGNSDDEAQIDVAPEAPANWQNPAWFDLHGTKTLSKLISYCSNAHFVFVPAWLEELRKLVRSLLSKVCRQGISNHEQGLNLGAYLLLPGLIEKVRKISTKEVLPMLRGFRNSQCMALAVVVRCTELYLRRTPRNPSNTSTLSAKTLNKLVKEGRLANAQRSIERDFFDRGGTGLSLNMTKEIVASLHPKRCDRDSLPALPDNTPATPMIEREHFLKATFSLPMAAANGHSGWTYALIRKLVGQSLNKHDEIFIETNITFINMLCSGSILSHAMKLITISRMVLISKVEGRANPILIPNPDPAVLELGVDPNPIPIPNHIPDPNPNPNIPGHPHLPKMRPISVGESMLRFAHRMLAKRLNLVIQEVLEPLQYGVCTKGGCEVIASIAQLTYDGGMVGSQPEGDNYNVQLGLDLPNGFNNMRRGPMFDAIQNMCPQLLRTFHSYYQHPSLLVGNSNDAEMGEVGCCETGIKQGDPLSSAYFSFALAPALTDINTLLDSQHEHSLTTGRYVHAFIDDILIRGDGLTLARNFGRIEDIIHNATGVKPNPKKSWVLNASVDVATLFLNSQPNIRIVDNNNAVMVLGVPVGSVLGRTSLINEAVRDMDDAFSSLRHDLLEHDGQLKFALLSKCLHPKGLYIARNVEPTIGHNALASFDTMVRRSLEEIIHAPLNNPASSLYTMPIVYGGGLGLGLYASAHGTNCRLSQIELVGSTLGRLAALDTQSRDVYQCFMANPIPKLPSNVADYLAVHNLANPDAIVDDITHQLRQNRGLTIIDPATLPVTITADIEHNNTKQCRRKNLYSFYNYTFISAIGAMCNNEADVPQARHLGSMLLAATRRLNSYDHGGLWLLWMGGGNEQQRLKGIAFETLLRARLGLPPSGAIHRCVQLHQSCANTTPDTFPLHGLTCRTTQGAKAITCNRHGLVVRYIRELIGQCAYPGRPPNDIPVELEVDLGMVENRNADERVAVPLVMLRADLVWNREATGAQGATQYVFDVTIIEPTGVRGDRDHNRPLKRGIAAYTAENDKARYYAQLGIARNRKIITFALESGGTMGGQASDFLSHLGETENKKPEVKSFIRRLSSAMAHGVALMQNNHAAQNEEAYAAGHPPHPELGVVVEDP